MRVCGPCRGSGRVRSTPYTWVPCEICRGTGFLNEPATAPLLDEVTKVECPLCRGVGCVTPTEAAAHRAAIKPTE